MLQGPFHRALTLMLDAGKALLACLAPNRAPAEIPAITQIKPARVTAADRIATALIWLEALRRVLAGDPFYRHPIAFPRFPRFPGRYPALTAQLRAEIGLPPVPARTEAQRAAARLHHMRKTFATVPTSRLATRLARNLGIAPPPVLLAIHEPPAEIGRFWEARKQKRRPGALPLDPAGADAPDQHDLRRPEYPGPS